jgi:hypothetical protein
MGKLIKKKQTKILLAVIAIVVLIGVAYSYESGSLTLLGNIKIVGNQNINGSTPLSLGSHGTNIGVRKITFTKSFRLSSFHIYAKSCNNYSQAVKFVLYTNVNDKPSLLMYYTTDYFTIGNSLKWYSTNLLQTRIFPAGTYWFGVLSCNPIYQYTTNPPGVTPSFYIAPDDWPIPRTTASTGSSYPVDACSYLVYV